MEALAGALIAGLRTTFAFFWDSFFGLVFGFLISAIVQVVFSRRAMHRFLGPDLRGILNGTAFGIVASACSYGAAAAARGFYQKGADVRAVFAFMISSTNMNLAILILFWTLIGWKFAFAEFFGGIVIIAVVAAGASVLLRPDELRAPNPGGAVAAPSQPGACLQCGMAGDDDHAVEFAGTTYRFCGARHASEFRSDPHGVLGTDEGPAAGAARGLSALREATTWREIVDVALGDVAMLRNELVLGYVIAGFAAALVPPAWLADALHAVGSVPLLGYPLLLLTGLALAAVTFICSMGNVPIARFLATAGIPLGANTTFIYGDLLIPPLIGIYRKSFPAKVTLTFLGSFVIGAMAAGALMDALVGGVFGGVTLGSMDLSDRFTLGANVLAAGALIAVAVAASRGRVAARVPA